MPWQTQSVVQLIAGNTIINQSGLFLYNGTPAAGNTPIFVAAVPGTTVDPFGNAIGAIVEIGQHGSGHWHWDSVANLDINNLSAQTYATIRPGDQGFLLYKPFGAAGNLAASLTAAGGTDQFGNTFPAGVNALAYQAPPVSIPPFTSGSGNLYVDTSGAWAFVTGKNLAANLSGAQRTGCSVFTVTSATINTLAGGKAFTGGDPEVGAQYELECWGSGTWGSTAQALTLYITLGSGASIQQNTIAANAISPSLALRWYARCVVKCVTTGVSGTWDAVLTGSINQFANPLNPSLAANMTMPFTASNTVSATIDTTVDTNLLLQASWGSTTGAPTITAKNGTLKRIC